MKLLIGLIYLGMAFAITVTIDSGVVVGSTSQLSQYWLGIPYAASTGGSNRWMPPQPVIPWSTPLDCTQFGPGCIQTGHNPDVPTNQSEACLNLNVYAPLGSQAGDDLDVMVFIHGGAFLEGSNQGPFGIYRGEYMAHRGNVVVVTINYRLGALGFLVTDTLNGNFGFMDQQAALKWVQRNIKAFGGNPNEVTLFGESAGAMSTGLHLLAPSSKGLFNKVIMESNPLGLLYKNLSQANDYGQAFCGYLNCSIDDNHCNADCMRAAGVDAVKQAWQKAGSNVWVYIKANFKHLLDGFLDFTPCVDGNLILEEPLYALQAGRFDTSIPIMVGTNHDEGQTFVYDSLDKPLAMWEYEALVFIIFPDWSKSILNRYANSSITDGRWPFSQIFTDYLMACASQQFAIQSVQRGGSAFVYRYDHVFSAGWLFPKFGLPAICANLTCHAAELPLVFHNDVHNSIVNVTFTPAEAAMSDHMVEYWTNFAHYKNPNGNGSNPNLPNWPQFQPQTRNVLLINEQITVGSSYDLCTFWDAIDYNH